jgi:hypothetical protein
MHGGFSQRDHQQREDHPLVVGETVPKALPAF